MNTAGWIYTTELKTGNWFQQLRMKRWLRRTTVFVRSCRVVVQSTTGTPLLRFTYLSNSSYHTGEQGAEQCLENLLAENVFGADQVLEQQWKRGRMVTDKTLASEDQVVQMACYHLWCYGMNDLLTVERFDDYKRPTPSQPAPATTLHVK